MHDDTPLGEPLPRKRRKGIYILPNLFTLAALFGGFYAIVMAMNDHFSSAAVGPKRPSEAICPWMSRRTCSGSAPSTSVLKGATPCLWR